MTSTTTELVIAGLPAMAVVVAVVAAAKSLGLPARWAPLASVGVGLLVALAAELAVVLPGTRSWIEAVVEGVVLGLSATGAYAVVSKSAERSN